MSIEPSSLGVATVTETVVQQGESEPRSRRRKRPNGEPFPTMREVMAVIPESCFERNLWRSSAYLFCSLVLTIGSGVLAWLFIPLTWQALPLWCLYAAATGTFATGVWVVAHECGHGAFCKNKLLQDTVGFVLHSLLLVPYFSWQRSHAIHHAKTNHMDEGETHVPTRADSAMAVYWRKVRHVIGDDAFAVYNLAIHVTIGWPLYLLLGITGGPSRGRTNHFWPGWPFANDMFVGRWKAKVLLSDVGIVSTIAGLVTWAYLAGSIVPVLALYVGPYLVVNFWLVLYTWLQHTDTDIPHWDAPEWNWVEGAFATVDRPYGPVLNFLHHRIGSTHVAHHINARIPHYHAQRATEAIREAFPDLYRFDPTPIPLATWRVAKKCICVRETDDGWVYSES